MGIRVILLTCLLSGCALLPDSVRPELEHLSHATQHEPFTDHPTNYGAEIAGLMLHWDLPHAYLEVGEGYSLDPRSEILGPREQFSARIGVIIGIPKGK